MRPVQVRIDAAALLHEVVEGWFPLRNIKGKTMKGGGEIKLRVRLIGIPGNPVYARGINAQDPKSAAVEDAFFPEHSGNQVVMYQVPKHCCMATHSSAEYQEATYKFLRPLANFCICQSIFAHKKWAHCPAEADIDLGTKV